jgi:hypothetical protein
MTTALLSDLDQVRLATDLTLRLSRACESLDFRAVPFDELETLREAWATLVRVLGPCACPTHPGDREIEHD